MANTRYPVTNAQRQNHGRLLTRPGVCERLGISRLTYYDWRKAHKAPPFLILPNAQIRVREYDRGDWVATRMVPGMRTHVSLDGERPRTRLLPSPDPAQARWNALTQRSSFPQAFPCTGVWGVICINTCEWGL